MSKAPTALRVLVAKAEAFLLKRGRFPVWRKRRKTSVRYSIISACYNVEPYIDQFMATWLTQSVAPAALEIIIVDDGSTDGTATRIEHWRRRFPVRIKTIRKDNGGVASARNLGLSHATGDWISFPDPDDFIAPDCLKAVNSECARPSAGALALVQTNSITFDEKSATFVNKQRMKSALKGNRTVFDKNDPAMPILIHANSAWFRRDEIADLMLTFDQRVVPTFEDGHFLQRYLTFAKTSQVAFLKTAKYYYRKRASADSLVDLAASKPSWLTDKLRFGVAGLLDATARDGGAAPVFVQRAALLTLLAAVRHFLFNPATAGNFAPEVISEHKDLTQLVLSRISLATIIAFPKQHISAVECFGLAMLKGETPLPRTVRITDWDVRQSLLKLRFLHANVNDELSVQVDGRHAAVKFHKRRVRTLLDQPFGIETSMWVLAAQLGVLQVAVDGTNCPLTFADEAPALTVDLAAVTARFEARSQTQKPKAGGQFLNCWLFLDRNSIADDSAEHLYRHLLAQSPGANAYFVLRRESPDWQRLQLDGFRLLEFGTADHERALRLASVVVSSHADRYILAPRGKYIWPAQTRRYVFLDHGVITADLSDWLNTTKFDLFTTSTKAEYLSIVDANSPYKFSAKEVKLTGLPRHDRLVSLPRTRKTILIAPTWRSYLLGKARAGTFERPSAAGFEQSAFLNTWKTLLNAPELAAIAGHHGLKIVFRPHPNMVPSVGDFVASANIEVSLPSEPTSIQFRFCEAAVLITDFSSVFNEIAILDKPVIHFHFDADDALSGKHVYKKGYFDYERDGFGPICMDQAAVLHAVNDVLSGNEDPQYQKRRDATFELRDGKCCARVLAEIENLAGPPPAAV